MNDSPKPLQLLETAGAVIDAVGGTAAAHRLTGASMGSVSNWRADGRLAPWSYLIFKAALAELGAEAPAALWSIKDPAHSITVSGAV